MASEHDLIEARRAHAHKLAELGTQAFPSLSVAQPEQEREAMRQAVLTAHTPDLRAKLPHEADLSPTAPVVTVYGRVMAKRGPFLVLRTPFGDLQALVRADNLQAEQAAQFKIVDLSDHVIVRGPLMQTRTGDAALRAQSYQHASKALLPPPEKWHGLTDIEKRYRERYVDLFANPEVNQVFKARALILRALRDYFTEHHFLEVETPLLQPLRGGATAKPFTTHHNALDMSLFLRIAPELYLKRLIVGGLDRVFEIGNAFRNEGISTRHNPEFTILEFYTAFATCEDLYGFTEAMFEFVNAELLKTYPSFAEARRFSLNRPWKRVTIRQAIADAARAQSEDAKASLGELFKSWQLLAEIKPDASFSDPQALDALIAKISEKMPKIPRENLHKCTVMGDKIYVLFEYFAEPMLTRLYRTSDAQHSVPVFIHEYPASVSPLARRNDQNAEWVDRFELFIEGREVANAFSELNDPDDQAGRFNDQLKRREAGDEEAMDFDHDYIRALSYGMPPAAGFGMGIDRLVMMLCNQESIRDVLLFPLLRPEHQAPHNKDDLGESTG